MRPIYFRFILLLAVPLTILISCKHRIEDLTPPPGSGGVPGGPGSTTSCDPSKVYFQQQVLPILISNCALSGCHDDASHQEGIILTSYIKVMSTGDVRPGNPGGSDLYKSITETDPGDRMPQPPRNPLSPEQILLIRRWIEQGAQDLVCTSLCDSSQFTFSGAIKPLIANKCQGCHSGIAAQGGIDLSTHAAIKARVTDGKLWGSINHLPGFFPMPKNGIKISDCEINQVKKWIDAGSPNN
jgi:hypothetical protein